MIIGAVMVVTEWYFDLQLLQLVPRVISSNTVYGKVYPNVLRCRPLFVTLSI